MKLSSCVECVIVILILIPRIGRVPLIQCTLVLLCPSMILRSTSSDRSFINIVELVVVAEVICIAISSVSIP